MHRLTTGICLSASLLALGLAVFGLLRREEGGAGPERDDRSLGEALAALDERVAELEKVSLATGRGAKAGWAAKKASWSKGGQAKPEKSALKDSASLEEQVEALTARLSQLESPETLATLALSGERQAKEKAFRKAFDTLLDPESDAAERVASLQRIRRAFKRDGELLKEIFVENELSEIDIMLPVLAVAQDTQQAPELRADAVRAIRDSKHGELRQPLMDLLAFDDSTAVRVEAVDALMRHVHHPEVQEVIRQTAEGDSQPEVQEMAEERMPWLNKVVAHQEREAAHRARVEAGVEAPGQAGGEAAGAAGK